MYLQQSPRWRAQLKMVSRRYNSFAQKLSTIGVSLMQMHLQRAVDLFLVSAAIILPSFSTERGSYGGNGMSGS
ncbi:hypothetical protein KC19_8G107200 [Ceratodon purpureus]|uniref:Uncharacterized protein n=1 Tax=Ceratodon purpureus TaxID=3225 RepID=A0A8T0GZU9_CERPU|nr:hypothetical protein KC19_8G107200 [Ceratodon purpureus]